MTTLALFFFAVLFVASSAVMLLDVCVGERRQ